MKSILSVVLLVLLASSITAADRDLPEEIRSLDSDHLAFARNMHIIRPVIDTAIVLFGLEDTTSFWFKFKIDGSGMAKDLMLLYDPIGDSTLAHLATGMMNKLEFDEPKGRKRRDWHYFELRLFEGGEVSMPGSAAWEEALRQYEPVYGIEGREPIDVYPEMVSMYQPDYPDEARASGMQGSVEVEVIVDPTGDAVLARIKTSSGSKHIDFAAMVAAEKCEFKPAGKDGKPVTTVIRFTYSFKLTR